MQTRRDQLHAYRFLTRRALAALVSGQPNAVDPPMRRLTVTTIAGIMIAILVVAGFALFGYLKPSAGNTWKAAGTIIVERETGARYVYLDNRLHPVLNYSSGVLAASGSNNQAVHVTLVDRSELSNVKRGATIGIDGLPDSVPSASDLVTSPWTVCSRQKVIGTQLVAQVSLSIGSTIAAKRMAANDAVLVRTPDSPTLFLVWHGTRLRIPSSYASRVGTLLELPINSPLVVGTAFVDGLAPGTTLAPPQLSGLGGPAVSVGGTATRVGQVLYTSDTRQFYVALTDGIAQLTEVEADLLRAVTVNRRALPERQITSNDILNVPQNAGSFRAVSKALAGLPTTPPRIDTEAQQNRDICAVHRADAHGDVTGAPFLALPTKPTLPAVGSAGVVDSGGAQASPVVIDPGHAAIIEDENGSPTVFMVADPGKKFAFATTKLLSIFGYGSVRPSVISPQLFSLIGTGPALVPANARRPPSSG